MDFEELKTQMHEIFEKVREDRDKFFDGIKGQIEEAIELINSFDKIYVLGGLGLRLLKSNPNFYNVFFRRAQEIGIGNS